MKATIPDFATACTNPGSSLVSRTLEIQSLFPEQGFRDDSEYILNTLDEKEVILTFDDGPSRHSTADTLKILDEKCVKVTFFMLGNMVSRNPDIAELVQKAGHTIGSHGHRHINFAKSSAEVAMADMLAGFNALRAVLGNDVAPFFRFPFLQPSPAVINALKEVNFRILDSHIESRDYVFTSPERLVRRIFRQLAKSNKGIILLHDTKKVTVHALPLLLKRLEAEGYRIVHLRPARSAYELARDSLMLNRLDSWAVKHVRYLETKRHGNSKLPTADKEVLEIQPTAAMPENKKTANNQG